MPAEGSRHWRPVGSMVSWDVKLQNHGEIYYFLGQAVPIGLWNYQRKLFKGALCLGYKDQRRNSSYYLLSMNTAHLIRWGVGDSSALSM